MSTPPVAAELTRWELAAENIAVRIRWLGLLLGYLLVNIPGPAQQDVLLLNAILALGLLYTLLDTACSLRGQVFLGQSPLLVSLMEALFIGLLCYYHTGLESPFRYYYLLSLICCAIRHPVSITCITCAIHGASAGLLYLAQPAETRELFNLILLLVVLGWVTWASTALARVLRQAGEHLGELNQALEENRRQLEERIAERTRELQETQAHLLHQEKMAAFGLLAAGIAHEVGNPLTSISSLVQMLQKRNADSYTQDKLALVSGQLQRIQGTLRELINFSRPASQEWRRESVAEIMHEALSIAKYYKRPRSRLLEPQIASDLPPLRARRDFLVQVILNLVLNAIDATERGGEVEVTARNNGLEVEIRVRDTGSGIPAEYHPRLFQPYFTTKKHGTGLGLFVSQQMIAAHGGRIEFTSTPGLGTEFRVYVPGAEPMQVRTASQGSLLSLREPSSAASAGGTP